MARMVWIGIGAAGGVYAYRKGEQAMERVRAEGVVGSAALLAKNARAAVDRLSSDPGPAAPPATAAADPAPRGLQVGSFRVTRAARPTGPATAPAPAALSAGTPVPVGDTGIDITDGATATAGARRRRKVR
jgi:hypothetical protein